LKRVNQILSLLLTALFLTPFVLINANNNGLGEAKKSIQSNGLTQEKFVNYDFLLRNNGIDFPAEKKFLSGLQRSFERDFLLGRVDFKQGKYKKTFDSLLQFLTEEPDYEQYYYLLAKAAHIIKSDTALLRNAFNGKLSYKILFLKGLLFYNRAKYVSAKYYFSAAVEKNPTDFEIKYMLAYTTRNLGDYSKAFELLADAETLLEPGSPEITKVDVAKGSLFYLSGDYSNAKKYYQKGKDEAERLDYNIEKIKALLNIAMIKDEEGKLGEARNDFVEALEIATIIQDSELVAICNSELAVSYTYTNELVEAKKRYKESYELFKKLHNDKRIALTANNIGNINLSIANYVEALQYYELGLLYAGDNPRTRMLLLRGLGNVFTNLSNYSRALEYYKQAKKIASEIKDLTAEAEADLGYGVLFFNLNQPEKSLEYLNDGIGKLKEDENPYLFSDFLQKIGIVKNSLGENEEAEKDLSKTVEIAERFGFIYNELTGKTWLAFVMNENGKTKEAVAKLKEAISLTKPYELDQLLGVQYLYLSGIEKENETANLELALKHSKAANDFNNLIEVNYRLGKYYQSKNNTKKAEKYFTEAVNIIEERSKDLFGNSEIQIAYFAKQLDVYNSLIDLYLEQENFVKAFELIDRSRSRNTLANLLQLKLQSIGDDDLFNEFYNLAWEIQNGSESDALKDEFYNLKEKIAKENPALVKYLSGKEKFISIPDTQKKLSGDQVLISIYVNEDATYIFKLDKKTFEHDKVEVGRRELNKLISKISPYYNKEYKFKNIFFNKDLFAFNCESSYKLYKEILRNEIRDISQNSKLIFSLPPELLNLPLEFLVTEYFSDSSPFKYDDKNYLINDFSVSYTPSIAIWNELNADEEHTESENILLIGDPVFNSDENLYTAQRGASEELIVNTRNIILSPLRFSKFEIEKISGLFGSDKVLLGKEATETKFKENCENSKLIHISTHSLLYKNDPLILFSNIDKENDGYLETGEILQLNLNAELVVLSSCKSGLGEIDKAEGVIGMEKAFFEAGAKSVILSDWDVDDKYTSELMSYFYSFLSEGLSKDRALRKAKTKFIKEVNGNPYYWAAFRLSGSDSPIRINANTGENKSYYLALLLIFISGYFLTKRYFTKKS